MLLDPTGFRVGTSKYPADEPSVLSLPDYASLWQRTASDTSEPLWLKSSFSVIFGLDSFTN